MGDCPSGWYPLPSFSFVVRPPAYGPHRPKPGPRFEYGGIISVTDNSPTHSIRDNWRRKLVMFVRWNEVEETLQRLKELNDAQTIY